MKTVGREILLAHGYGKREPTFMKSALEGFGGSWKNRQIMWAQQGRLRERGFSKFGKFSGRHKWKA